MTRALLMIAAAGAALSLGCFGPIFQVTLEEAKDPVPITEAKPEERKGPLPTTAQGNLEAGKERMRNRQWGEARESATKCLELDPKMAECHLLLGSVLAHDRNPEEGVVHYREFLRLAPNHERANEVRQIVKDYDDDVRRRSASPPAG